MGATVYSCVIDRHPLYCYQGLVFGSTLIDLAGVDPAAIVVHAIEGVPRGAHDALRRLGVKAATVPPFDPRHPYSNKLVQLQSAELQDADHVVLCDADIAFAEPLPCSAFGDQLRAKMVDFARPPIDWWREALPKFGFPGDPETALTTHSAQENYINNLNGGLYIAPRAVLARLREAWTRWNRIVLDRVDLLGRYRVHVDQVSLALALTELGESVAHLPLRFNLPTHVPVPASVSPEPPVALHYHKQLSLLGEILAMGDPAVDEVIAQINEVIVRRRLFEAVPVLRTLIVLAAKRVARKARAAVRYGGPSTYLCVPTVAMS